jgi:hypothetical protein
MRCGLEFDSLDGFGTWTFPAKMRQFITCRRHDLDCVIAASSQQVTSSMASYYLVDRHRAMVALLDLARPRRRPFIVVIGVAIAFMFMLGY